MGWFSNNRPRIHHHQWWQREEMDVLDPVAKVKTGVMVRFDCHCGAVKQVDFKAGFSPVIWVTEPTDVRDRAIKAAVTAIEAL